MFWFDFCAVVYCAIIIPALTCLENEQERLTFLSLHILLLSMFLRLFAATGSVCQKWNILASVTTGNDAQLHVQCHRVGSLELAMGGVFTPGKLENTINHGLIHLAVEYRGLRK